MRICLHPVCIVFLCLPLQAQTDVSALLARTAREAETFRANAPSILTEETLSQRAFMTPPHSHLAIGGAAEPLRARFFLHEIVSEYSVGLLKGTAPQQLVEYREFVSKDGSAVNSPDRARQSLLHAIQTGGESARKRILEDLSRLGLVDVATDYGLMLLAFTKQGLADLEVTPGGEGYVGAEESIWLNWRQTAGGMVEFRGKKVAHWPMEGKLWIRKSDGVPLRITCRIEHPDGKRLLRDEASVYYTVSAFGFVVPEAIVHRHFIDGDVLTENLYTYKPFHLFTTDTKIQYTDTPAAAPTKK